MCYRNTNVSHVVIMRPLTAGFFNMSWANVNYYSPENKQIVSVLIVCLVSNGHHNWVVVSNGHHNNYCVEVVMYVSVWSL